MSKQRIFLLVCLIVVAFALRFYKIEQIPSSLYYDEVDYGYHARSFIETSKDYFGTLSPFYVHSFNDIRTPIPAYLTVLTTLIFKTPELQVRMPSVVLGTITVFLVWVLVLTWTNNYWKAYLVAFMFAVSPWQIQFSRVSHEVTSMLTIYLLGLWFFFRGLKRKNFWLLLASIIALSLSVYTYRIMSLFAHITFVSLLIIFKKPLWDFGFKKLFILSVTAAAITLPFLYATTLGAPDLPRIAQLAITSDPNVPIWVQVNREIDSRSRDDPAILNPIPRPSYIFHNKPSSWLDSFLNNYYRSFSTEFLFVTGDTNWRHSVGQIGQLYMIDIIALILGLFYLLRNLKIKENRFLLAWLLLAPIPSSLTLDGAHHGARLFIFSAPLLIIVGIGWYFAFTTFKNIKFSKLIYLVVFLLWLGFLANFLHRYFIHYPLEAARYFGYGFKQAIAIISKEEGKYKHIKMVATEDPPMIYYLFWANVPPKALQKYGTNFSEEFNLGQQLDKVKVVDMRMSEDKDVNISDLLREDTLYLVTPTELTIDLKKESIPQGIKLVDFVKYPDNETAFYLITKDPSPKY